MSIDNMLGEDTVTEVTVSTEKLQGTLKWLYPSIPTRQMDTLVLVLGWE